MAKVSIVVPIYNTAKFLEQCLDSLVNQTLRDIEIICVNDGSTDNSLEIIKSYASKDDRIKIIDKPNAGLGHTYNVGIDAASADYIGFLESDDFADVNMFSDLYKLITEHDVDYVQSERYEYADWKKTSKLSRDASVKTGIISDVEDKYKLISSPNAIWTGLYKKSFLNSSNIRFLETPGAAFQDISFCFKVIVLAKSIYFTRNAYIHYRIDNPNSSVKRKDGADFIYKEHDEIERVLNENPGLKKAYNASRLSLLYYHCVWNLLRIAPEYRKNAFEKFVKKFQTYYENGEFDNDDAFKFLDKKKVMLLLNNPKKAMREILLSPFKTKLQNFRRNLFRMRIGSKEKYLYILGKKIL